MSWIEKTDNWLEGLGESRRRRQLKPKKAPEPEVVYTVKEIANILKVNRNTVFKWIETDVLGPEDYFRLPGGYLRIRHSALMKLMNQI
ncbi:MAG: helix-turn-helix domain-containing protein [Deltaproteobacteria bacterium]|nr:helix-turn-helix domain-containing protein [Deltaproteobacteria bacterium]MBW2124214.1 helix-turn-helix domain-containing protein [Deltaproteobacteria bacterium]